MLISFWNLIGSITVFLACWTDRKSLNFNRLFFVEKKKIQAESNLIPEVATYMQYSTYYRKSAYLIRFFFR